MTIDLTADAGIFFTDFAQTVEFRGNADTEARSISANVNRQQVEDDRELPYAGSRIPTIHIMARNDSTYGVLASEVEPEVSEIKVAFPEGATARWRQILRVLRSNAGCVLLEVKS